MGPAVKETQPVTVAFIEVRGHFDQIPAAFGRLYDWIGERGYEPSGPAIAVYHTIPGQVPDEELRWELRSRVSGDVPECGPDAGGLGVKRLEAALVAAVMHKGPYEELEQVHEALMQWIEQNGYETSGPPEEAYFNDPSKVAPDELLTEIRLPVRRR
jgi:effector-binding domain-containing protein